MYQTNFVNEKDILKSKIQLLRVPKPTVSFDGAARMRRLFCLGGYFT